MENSFKKGVSLYKEKKYEQSLKELLKSDHNIADNPDLSYYIGLCYTQLKKYDEAVLFLEQVITSHTNVLYIYQCRMILCYIYAVTEQYRMAEFEIKKLIEDGYESAQIYCSYGYIYYHQDKKDKSLEYFNKALAVDPEHAATLNSVGYILADENIDPSLAVEYCSRAVDKSPGHYPYLDSLGWAYYKAGDSDKALIYLRDAFDRSKGHRIVAKHLKTVIDSRK